MCAQQTTLIALHLHVTITEYRAHAVWFVVVENVPVEVEQHPGTIAYCVLSMLFLIRRFQTFIKLLEDYHAIIRLPLGILHKAHAFAPLVLLGVALDERA